jgi:hypothetical protein
MSRTTLIPLILMSFVMLAAPMSGCIAVFKPGAGADGSENWIDPVIEIEDENHTHIDLLAHRLATANARLIDYHNLNCDGNEKPPAEFDDTMGRPCLEESKNTPPTPGDNSEISIEGNFLEDCEIYPDGSGGCYAYVAGYQQFEILDISNPNNIQLLSTYYAEVARIIDIKVSPDNNWVLINHELTNSELDPIPNDDDANSGMNRLDVIYVGEKTSPVKVAEWNNPPAGFHNQDMHVYCGWDGALDPREECSLFLFGADPYPELVEGGSGSRYKGTQIFYVPLGFESWLPNQNNEQQNSSREIIRWGGYSPESQTTCGGSVFNHDNVYFTHPITKQKLLAVSYWGAGLRFVDVSNPPTVADPFGISWPPEIGRWLGCPTADDGWYGPDGGGHANMSAEEWLDSAQGNDNIHYAVPMDNLICSGVSESDPIEDWPEQCGSGPEDPTHGINWRHLTFISPEYGSNDNHTGYIWTIDTTDPTKPFLVSKWRLPGEGMKANGTSHPQHWIPGGYIYSPHNGDTGPNGHAYWAHYHAGAWATDHSKIWDELVWENGFAEPERGFQAIVQLAETHTIGYYLPAGPTWIEDPAATLGWDTADCWASCMIPFDWGLQYDPRGFVFISEMVTGVYVVQFDEDWDSRFDYPPLWSAQATDEE